MRKVNKYIIIIILFIVLIPNVSAASKTLGDYEKELANLQGKSNQNKALSASAQKDIDNKRQAITNANNEISSNEQKTEVAKQKVEDSQNQIVQVNGELDELFRFMQLANGENVYLDYLANATSISDLIERTAIVEQLADYQKSELARLSGLINTNTQLQIDLKNQNEQLASSITTYESKIDELEAYLDELADYGMDLAEEIEAQQKLINKYKEAGCKSSDYVDDCYYNKMVNASGFLRPLASGRVNSLYGGRTSPITGKYSFHSGIDLGVPQGTNVYSPAPGVVAAVKYRASCGGNQIYIHHTVNGKAYTTLFAHLLSINVKPGDKVTASTVIAQSGGGASTWSYDKCTTGAHLHYTVADGYYLGVGANGYSNYNTFINKTSVTGNASIIGIKNQKGFSWSTRVF